MADVTETFRVTINCQSRVHSENARVEFFEIRRYSSKVAGNSADTAVNLLRNADVPLS